MRSLVLVSNGETSNTLAPSSPITAGVVKELDETVILKVSVVTPETSYDPLIPSLSTPVICTKSPFSIP